MITHPRSIAHLTPNGITHPSLIAHLNPSRITHPTFFRVHRLTVIPGPPLFSLTVQLLDPFPRRVEFIKDTQQFPPYGQRLY